MKRTDLAMIVFIAAASAGIAYFVASSVLGNMTEQAVKVKTVDPITSTVETPDDKIFNENAINPSVEVNINNTDPVVEETQPSAGADTVENTDTNTNNDASTDDVDTP